MEASFMSPNHDEQDHSKHYDTEEPDVNDDFISTFNFQDTKQKFKDTNQNTTQPITPVK